MRLSLFGEVSGSRSTYGLRHDDYGRYQSHCTSKVARLRKATKETQKKGQGKQGDKFTRKPITNESVSTQKHLLVLLYETERDWAHSRALQAQAKTSRQSHHSHRRLAKAARAARALLDAARGHLDDERDTAQCIAYALLLKGELFFETGKHEQGAQTFKAVKTLLDQLARTATMAKEQVVIREHADTVEPMLRYCAYQLQRDQSAVEANAGDLEQEYRSALEHLDGREAVQAAEPLVFGGRKIPLVIPELVEGFEKVRRALAALQSNASASSKSTRALKRAQRIGPKRMAKFDAALAALSETEAEASRLRSEMVSTSTKERDGKENESVVLAHEYLQYHIHVTRASRDLALASRMQSKMPSLALALAEADEDGGASVSKTKKKLAKSVTALVKLYDNVLVSFESMRELSIVESASGGDDALIETIEGRIAGTKARRALHLAQAYALLSKYAESIALVTRGTLYVREASSFLSTAAAPTPDDALPELPMSRDELEREYGSTRKAVEKAWYDDEHFVTDQLDLGAVDLDQSTAAQKRRRETFFDVAFSYVTSWDTELIRQKAGLVPVAAAGNVEQDTVMEFIEPASTAGISEEQQQKKKGWFGFWK